MPRYRIAFLVETSLFNRLEGYYQINGYLLKPSLVTESNKKNDRANFVLDFLSEEGSMREGWGRLEATHNATREATTFLSFAVLATRRWAQLAKSYTENSIRYGPVVFYRIGFLRLHLMRAYNGARVKSHMFWQSFFNAFAESGLSHSIDSSHEPSPKEVVSWFPLSFLTRPFFHIPLLHYGMRA